MENIVKMFDKLVTKECRLSKLYGNKCIKGRAKVVLKEFLSIIVVRYLVKIVYILY
jgi:hypothetical protein